LETADEKERAAGEEERLDCSDLSEGASAGLCGELTEVSDHQERTPSARKTPIIKV